MVFMYSFCFWYSLRLGSLMIGVLCLLKSLICLCFFGYGYCNPDWIKEVISSWIREYTITFTKSFFSSLKDDPESYFMISIIVDSFYAVSCLLLMYGAYSCRAGFAWVWVVLELCRLLVLGVCSGTALALLKQNSTDVGLLIGATVVVGFIFLALFYTWFCVISFIQIVTELEGAEKANSLPSHNLLMRNAILRRYSEEDEQVGPYFQTTSFTTAPIDGADWHRHFGLENRKNLRNYAFRDKSRIDRY